ncbi:MAG: methylmalonyl-CoA epimerase [Candidatus Thermoplasmatota archaeon]
MNLDHVCICVSDLELAIKKYEKILSTNNWKTEEFDGMRICFFELGNAKIELIQPIDNPNLQKFIEKRGEGLHHIALSLENIEEKLIELKGKGIKLIDEKPRKGAMGRKVAFVHPKELSNVLIEFVEEGLCQ